MTLFQFTRELFNKFPRLFAKNVGLLFISSGLESLVLLTLVPVVDLLSLRDMSTAGPLTKHFFEGMRFFGMTPTLSQTMIILLFLQIAASGVYILANYSILNSKYSMLREIMLGSFRDFFGAKYYFFSSSSQGTLLNTFSRAVTQVGDAISGLGLFFVLLARMVFYIAVMLVISWQLTLLSTVLAALFIWPFLRLGKRSYRWGQTDMRTTNEMMSILQDSLGGAKVVQGFGNERKSEEDLLNAFQNHYKATIKFQTLSNIIPAAYKPSGLLVLIVVLFVSRRLNVPFSEIAVIMLAFLQMIPLFAQLAGNKSVAQNALPAYEQIKALRQAARLLERHSGPRKFQSFERELALDHVGFSYPDRPPVLVDVSLRIPKGQFVAVVGESGVGKSTLVDLIMALNDPSRGKITMDGVPLTEFNVQSYRRCIGYVPQESLLFDRSIKENLLWANENASEDDLRSACQKAHVVEFINKLPKGYDTIIGNRGIRLSGGQAQRLALARAILRNPFLLVLDEATSALDTHSERLIQQAIESISKETTIIAIAHRLSTVRKADHIVLLQAGLIAEEGTYDDLVNRGGLFHRMAGLQMLNPIP
jgi:subfamily B ATP-binding cassette protein MsbA